MTRVQESLLYKIARGVLGLYGPCKSSSPHTGRGHGPCWIEGIITGCEGLGLHGSGSAAQAVCGTAPLHGSLHTVRASCTGRAETRATGLGHGPGFLGRALRGKMGLGAGFGL